MGGVAVDNTGELVAVSRLDGPWLWRRTKDEIVRLPYREHWSFCTEVSADKRGAPGAFRWGAVMDGRGTAWHARARHPLVMSDDGATLYFGGHDGAVISYDLNAPAPRPKLLYRHTTAVVGIDLAGEAVASVGHRDPPVLFEGGKARRLEEANGMDRSRALAFSPDARRFVVAQPMRFWEVGGAAKPHRTESFIGNHPFTADAEWTADGRHVVGAGEAIVVWDVKAEKTLVSQRFESGPFMTALSPDGTVLATSHNGFVQLWDPMTAKKTRKLKGIKGVTMAMGWSPDGSHLALADADGMRVQVQTL